MKNAIRCTVGLIGVMLIVSEPANVENWTAVFIASKVLGFALVMAAMKGAKK